MSNPFCIDLNWLRSDSDSSPSESTFAEIQISAGETVFSELEDLVARTTRLALRAPAYDLALWFAENWWRLRWEPESRMIGWLMSHVMASIANGVAWPNLSFISDGLHVLLTSKRTHRDPGAPVRYLRSHDVSIHAKDFVAGIDRFIESVLARMSSLSQRAEELEELWQVLLDERNDPQKGSVRRLEALLGFDSGFAPDELLNTLQGLSSDAGVEAIEEVAAAGKEDTVDLLRNAVLQAQSSQTRIAITSIANILQRYRIEANADDESWRRATVAARLARSIWGVENGPVSNNVLSDLFELPREYLKFSPHSHARIAAGFRHQNDRIGISMRARVETGRRFELMRLVADHLVAPQDEALLPATATRTDRQKFQRAFAQEFLLPYEELFEAIGRPDTNDFHVSEDDVEDIANTYNVSPRLVSTVLVNKLLMPREEIAIAG